MAGEERNIKVKIDGVRKVFNGRSGEMVALNGINMDILDNEFVCVVGPSGCGKSTLLNIIAGLMEPTSGNVFVDGKKVQGTGVERGVVFQQYALFPWLTVKKNVEFGLRLKNLPEDEIEEIAMKYIRMVDLEKFTNAYPKELSGGMKQRVAIARAYAVNPEVLLMDEPFGALDAQTRTQLQSELLKTWQEERKTCFFFTHDVEEAVLADQVILMGCPNGQKDTNTVLAQGSARIILTDCGLLKQAGIVPPMAVRMYEDLKLAGIELNRCPLTKEELAEALCRWKSEN